MDSGYGIKDLDYDDIIGNIIGHGNIIYGIQVVDTSMIYTMIS